MNQPKVILVVMDGWGYSATKEGNAIALATLPTFNTLWAICPHTLLRAFGQNVGLPWGATGSSEVGHKSIGSGKRISQEIAEIDKEINSDKFFKNKHLISFLEKSKVNKHPIHLVGLVSNGGVHSHTDHILAILEFLKAEEYKGQIYLHAITDGRDTDPKAAQKFFDMVDGKVKLLGLDCKIATVCGRYFTMDRNNRWDRTRKGYLLLTEGTGEEVSS
ncbi:MAG: hypothetical protein NTW50_01215 [Candidatus Berkelbacteria bacterium]|nr:hypothetical protein [Candidatus Berkelbacteria bacterium]